MPTIEWLKNEFAYGYQSGDILATKPDAQRSKEEKVIGGSYKYFFMKTVLPLLRPDSKVLELGPGGGSWTRALLHFLPQGEVHTCDFQDVTPWLQPELYGGRLTCHHVSDNLFQCLEDSSFDFFFSFGVLVHCNQSLIAEILTNVYPKMKPGAFALHNYGDWDKLTQWGWAQGTIPEEFKNQPDEEIWWPRNTGDAMVAIATKAQWTIVHKDTGSFPRDGIILLKKD